MIYQHDVTTMMIIPLSIGIFVLMQWDFYEKIYLVP